MEFVQILNHLFRVSTIVYISPITQTDITSITADWYYGFTVTLKNGLSVVISIQDDGQDIDILNEYRSSLITRIGFDR